MRSILVLLSLAPLVAVGQVIGEWMPLPEVEGTPAIETKYPAQIVRRYPKATPRMTRESYVPTTTTFVATIQPTVQHHLAFEEYDMPEPAITKRVGPMIFKDNATANIKYIDQSHGMPADGQGGNAQDPNGLIYICSSRGLTVYNGDMVWYYHDTEFFSFEGTFANYCDSKGRVWISSPNGPNQWCYLKDGKVYIPNHNIDAVILRFREDDEGKLWISTNHGAYVMTDDALLCYREGLPSECIWDAYPYSDGRIWLAQEFDDLLFIEHDSLFRVEGITVRSHSEYNGALWLGTVNDNLYKWRNDSLFAVQSLLAGNTSPIRGLVVTGKGLWGLCGKGVFLIRPDGTMDLLKNEQGFCHTSVSDIAADGFGNIWIGSFFRGVTRIDENVFHCDPDGPGTTFWSEQVQLGDEVFHWDQAGRLTVETDTEVLSYNYKDDEVHTLFWNQGYVTDTCVWVAGNLAGVTKFDGEGFTCYRGIKDDPAQEHRFYYVEGGADGRMWCLPAFGGLWSLEGTTFRDFSETTDWRDLSFTKVTKTQFGTIVAYTQTSEALLIDGDRYRRLGHRDGRDFGRIFHILEPAKGEFLVFGRTRTALVKANGEKTVFDHPVFKDCDTRDVAPLAKDKYIMATANGMRILQLYGDSFSVTTYASEYGPFMHTLRDVMVKGGRARIQNGNILYDPYYTDTNTSPPLVSLYGYTVDTLQINGPWVDTSIEQGVAIQLHFSNVRWGKKSQLQYRLLRDGSAPKWTDNANNTVAFDALSYGDYTLEVRASAGQLTSEILTYSFRVKPFWYQTWWAALLGFLITVVMALIYILYQRRKAQKTELRLQTLVDERTGELAKEKAIVSEQLEQKELLLKEVAHRVKNNMQMVSAILEMQSFRANDDASRAALEQGISRINSLAMAHQRLYQDQSFIDIDLKEYLEMIVEDLSRDTRYAIHTAIPEGYVLNIEKAQAIGFIFNELLTNSTKYAWPAEYDEERTIHFTIEETGDEIVMTYRDNGRGFKPDYSMETDRSLGSVLIKSFVDRQLEGTLETMNDYGAKTIITFQKAIGT